MKKLILSAIATVCFTFAVTSLSAQQTPARQNGNSGTSTSQDTTIRGKNNGTMDRNRNNPTTTPRQNNPNRPATNPNNPTTRPNGPTTSPTSPNTNPATPMTPNRGSSDEM